MLFHGATVISAVLLCRNQRYGCRKITTFASCNLIAVVLQNNAVCGYEYVGQQCKECICTYDRTEALCLLSLKMCGGSFSNLQLLLWRPGPAIHLGQALQLHSNGLCVTDQDPTLFFVGMQNGSQTRGKGVSRPHTLATGASSCNRVIQECDGMTLRFCNQPFLFMCYIEPITFER